MALKQTKGWTVLVFVGLGTAVLLMAFPPAEAGLYDGKSYTFWISGIMLGSPYGERTFGSAPTAITGSVSGVLVLFSDDNTSAGLLPDQVRLRFVLSEMGSVRGAITEVGIFDIYGVSLPSGAAFLQNTIGVTYGFDDGRAPITYALPSGTVSALSGIMFRPWSVGAGSGVLGASSASFEIVVDNIPEPATIALFAAGSSGLLGAFMMRNRRER